MIIATIVDANNFDIFQSLFFDAIKALLEVLFGVENWNNDRYFDGRFHIDNYNIFVKI